MLWKLRVRHTEKWTKLFIVARRREVRGLDFFDNKLRGCAFVADLFIGARRRGIDDVMINVAGGVSKRRL